MHNGIYVFKHTCGADVSRHIMSFQLNPLKESRKLYEAAIFSHLSNRCKMYIIHIKRLKRELRYSLDHYPKFTIDSDEYYHNEYMDVIETITKYEYWLNTLNCHTFLKDIFREFPHMFTIPNTPNDQMMMTYKVRKICP